MEYFREIAPWTINNENIDVVIDNEHVGLIVSGQHSEEKNVENKLNKGRKSLFSLLGPAFQQKCMLSPVVKVHLYRLFTWPIGDYIENSRFKIRVQDSRFRIQNSKFIILTLL